MVCFLKAKCQYYTYFHSMYEHVYIYVCARMYACMYTLLHLDMGPRKFERFQHLQLHNI